jgi:hypothetical protein
MDKVPGDKYANFLANSLVEIPAYAIGGILLYRFGLRVTLYIGTSLAVIGGTLLIIYGDEV